MAFCLVKEKAEKFKKLIKAGGVKYINDLVEMTSAERRTEFMNKLGLDEINARELNAQFESKLVLKYQKTGLKNWIEKASGLKPETKRDLISRINRMDKVLDGEEGKMFLEDLAAKKLGIGVSEEEAKEIYDLSKKANDKRALAEAKEWTDKKLNIDYGNSVLDFQEYTDGLSPKKANIVQNILNAPRTLKSTLDLSAPLRQGWGMISRPVQWSKAFGNMFKYAVSKKSFRDLQADIISRPTYKLMENGGLRISILAKKLEQREDDFMSNLVGKIPGVGVSERAYVGFLNKLRADVFDDLVGRAEMAGEDISMGSQTLKDIANVVNDFTGSGNIGKGDRYSGQAPWLNATFFSPRKISATINMFNPQRYLDPRISKTARKAAARQLAGMLGMTATILGLASAAGVDVEPDTTSSDFGKIKIGNTRFDMTGGNGTYAVLLARMILGRTKSTTSGKIYKLGEGYKPTERKDLVLDFTRNKFSPVASAIATALGWSFDKEDRSIKKQAQNLFVPMIIDNSIEQMSTDKEMLPFSILSELFGIGVQSY